MSKCDDVQELLSAYIDRALADDERRRVGAHLDECAQCRAAVTALAGSLRRIEPGKRGRAIAPAKRWWASPRVAVFVATGAVAAIALVSLLALGDINITGDQGATQKTTSPAENKAMPQQSVPESADTWPKILASDKNYTAASIETLAGEIHDSSNGLYTVEDAKEKRGAFVNAIVKEVSAQGGEGEKTRSPLNAILDRTKRAALPIYVEKAKYENKACLVIAIKWGFGGGGNRLYKTSLYVTNLSGWTIFHYTSK
ncbi:MAG: zf-HC2 domain-containing protein [Actinobacteria bacterium]|nr:zf-HC2 domain-containing protein [Actinomycetota bacterium]